jgi:hypothetical protein
VPADVRALLRAITPAGDRLLTALERAGLTSALRQAPSCYLHALDRALPRETLDDLLASCEAFAVVTAPTALKQDDSLALFAEAAYLLGTLRTLARATRPRSRSSRLTSFSMSMQAPLLREAFSQPAVADALRDLVAHFEALVALESGEPARRRRWMALLPAGLRFLMPGAVLAVTLLLIAGLLGAVVIASGASNARSQGSARSTPLKHPTVAASATRGAAPTATPPSHTVPLPAANPTATAVPQAQVLAVSPLDQAPCSGGPDAHFTVTFTSGPGTITWSATSSNPANVALSLDGAAFGSQVSGALKAGQQAVITVRALQDNYTQINVATSAGSYVVVADSTGC